MIMNQILGKTLKTNQEKCQSRSVFELKTCKEIKEFYRYFGVFVWSFLCYKTLWIGNL